MTYNILKPEDVERIARAIREQVRGSVAIVTGDGEATYRRCIEAITLCCHSVNWPERFRRAIDQALQQQSVSSTAPRRETLDKALDRATNDAIEQSLAETAAEFDKRFGNPSVVDSTDLDARFDYQSIYNEARKRFLNDATQPIGIEETLARVAFEAGTLIKRALSSAEGERASVVRWLREHQNSYSWRNHDLADAIERGDHLTHKGESNE